MKKLIFAVLVVSLLLTLSLVLTLGVSAAPSRGFTGAWESVDVDDSNQKMAIGGGGSGTYRVFLFDDGGTVCDFDPEGNLYPLIGLGEGTADGYDLVTDLALWCLKKPRESQVLVTVTFTYNAAGDTLEQYVGGIWDEWIIWNRMGGS